MVDILSGPPNEFDPLHSELLEQGETIAVVDDSPEIVLLLKQYLKNKGLPSISANLGSELLDLLRRQKVALVLLDIGLPDIDGNRLLDQIVPHYPDLAIIMVTGTTDLEIALDCLRRGADDYLTKPISINFFHHVVESTLRKRRLLINSRLFRQELEKSNNRMRFLHQLTLKMNTAFLNTVELRGILQSILAGITSSDGLRFNRAFLALFTEDRSKLQGVMATGPPSREQAGAIWNTLQQDPSPLDTLLSSIQAKQIHEDPRVNDIVRSICIDSNFNEHVLIYASRNQCSVNVLEGYAENCLVPQELTELLDEKSFAVVPLYSPDRSLGVILVDNYVTGIPITESDIHDLEIFAGQASLAIEHSSLYEAMSDKIDALELATHELEKSKNLLLEAEKNATIGEISGQLLHGIRNPLTSIGGTSRLLLKKTENESIRKLLAIIARESEKIETVLDDLFSYVEDIDIGTDPVDMFPLLRRSVLIFYPKLKQAKINYEFEFSGEKATVLVDEPKIRQAFLHLLRNSIEAMIDGGTLKVSGKKGETTVTITISDSGHGIPESVLKDIRQPFFTTKTYGNGMGLAIVDKIVSSHSGTFDIRSNSSTNRGTIATITLPLATMVDE